MTHIATRTVDQVDDYFGTPVADPYRWLEDTDAPEVVTWLAAQAAATRTALDALPGRSAITAALRGLIGLPGSGLPVHRGPSWFRTSNDGDQQQSVLLVEDEPFTTGRVLIDPNPVSSDASTSLAAATPSRDGGLVAYSYAEAGSDWQTWRVRDVASGADLPDVVRWGKFTEPAWLPDGSGFVYGGFDPPDDGAEYVSANVAHRLRLHRIGTGQSADEAVFALPSEPDVTFWAEVTEDGRWLLVFGSRGTEQQVRVWLRDLDEPGSSVRSLITDADASWELLGSSPRGLVMLTDRDAPLGRVVVLDPADGSAHELVAEREDTLQGGALCGGRLVLHWLHDASSHVTVHDLDGRPTGQLALPGLGTVTGFSARADEPLLHLGYTSFTTPPSVLACDATTGDVRTVFAPVVADADLVAEQTWAASKDGTRLPVFLVHRRDITPASGPHPAWLYGYGGFRIATTPTFEPTRYAFAAAGGVVAVACLRGGGEFGAAWHDAGRLQHKQNVFDDAVAAADHLIAEGWTSVRSLAASGRSNGGLLAGALLTQRPDLFAAVVPEVGVLDLLRFPLWTIGWAWISDYGDPRADEAQFRTLHEYSPLHNLRADAAYPPVLVLTSDHDDRVVPAHSLKFAARLQAVSPPDAVALLRVGPAGGHGAGRSHDALIDERADVLSFIAHHTGLAGLDPR